MCFGSDVIPSLWDSCTRVSSASIPLDGFATVESNAWLVNQPTTCWLPRTLLAVQSICRWFSEEHLTDCLAGDKPGIRFWPPRWLLPRSKWGSQQGHGSWPGSGPAQRGGSSGGQSSMSPARSRPLGPPQPAPLRAPEIGPSAWRGGVCGCPPGRLPACSVQSSMHELWTLRRGQPGSCLCRLRPWRSIDMRCRDNRQPSSADGSSPTPGTLKVCHQIYHHPYIIRPLRHVGLRTRKEQPVSAFERRSQHSLAR